MGAPGNPIAQYVNPGQISRAQGDRLAITRAHSPAPWSIGDHGGGADIRDAEGRRIASLAWGAGSVSMKVEFEACMANLRLMVAAPALLDGAAEVLAVWDSYRVGVPGDRATLGDVEYALGALRAAMALAEGEA